MKFTVENKKTFTTAEYQVFTGVLQPHDWPLFLQCPGCGLGYLTLNSASMPHNVHECLGYRRIEFYAPAYSKNTP